MHLPVIAHSPRSSRLKRTFCGFARSREIEIEEVSALTGAPTRLGTGEVLEGGAAAAAPSASAVASVEETEPTGAAGAATAAGGEVITATGNRPERRVSRKRPRPPLPSGDSAALRTIPQSRLRDFFETLSPSSATPGQEALRKTAFDAESDCSSGDDCCDDDCFVTSRTTRRKTAPSPPEGRADGVV